MDKKGPGLIMMLSFLGTITGLILLSQSTAEPSFLVAGFVLGLGNGIVMPTLQTMVINMVKAEKRGVATSTFFSSIDLGIGIGAFFLGNIAEIFSLSQMYLFCAIGMNIPAILFFGITLSDYKKKSKISIETANV